MKIRDFISNNKEYFEDFITRSTYHSNGIEGNTLSYLSYHIKALFYQKGAIKWLRREEITREDY